MTRALDDRPNTSDALRDVVADGVESRAVTARDDHLGERCRGQLGEREVRLPERTPAAEQGDQWQGSGQEVGWELVGVAADRLQEPDDPLVIGDVVVPGRTDLVGKRPP